MNRINLVRLTNQFLCTILPISCAWSVTPIDLRHTAAPLSHFLRSEPGQHVSFKTISTYTDFQKTEHKRLKQTYQSYAVWGAEIVVHKAKKSNPNSFKGSLTHANGFIYQGLNEELDPLPANKVMKEQEDRALAEATRQYKEKAESTAKITNSNASRIVFIDEKNKAHWAYYIELLALQNGAPSQISYIIDANSNALYSTWNNLHTIDNEDREDPSLVKGGGYGGNNRIGYKVYDGLTPGLTSFNIFRDSESKNCFLQGNAGKTPFKDTIFFSVNNGSKMMDSFESEPLKYFCQDKNPLHAGLYWNDDSTNAADNDAFYNANITNNMYMSWFNSPAVFILGTPDDNGDSDLLPTQIYTHLKMSNAAWIEPLKSIFLGDGSENDDTTPFTSLDVVAHELSHGFTNQNANLVYKNQSGGLNESFSDMAAVAASYYLTNESNWTIGSEIMDEPIRYINNPRHDCVGKSPYIDIGGYKIRKCSIDHVKDYKDGTIEGIPFVDVHFSSGLFNKAFYLMAQGFGGDKQQGTQKAFNVMVQANRGYWTPNTSFQDAACGVMEATRDYGYDETVVTKAMSSIGIDLNKCW